MQEKPADKEEDATNATVVAVDNSPFEVPERGLRFWMCVVALMMSTFLVALDIVSPLSFVYFLLCCI